MSLYDWEEQNVFDDDPLDSEYVDYLKERIRDRLDEVCAEEGEFLEICWAAFTVEEAVYLNYLAEGMDA